MRTIKLGGHTYQIRGSIMVHAEAARRRNALLQQADREAEEEAKNREIDANELIAEKRAAALSGPEYDAGEMLQLLSDLINAAVEYYAVLCGQDISGTVFGGYPMTPQKLCFIANVAELNSPEVYEPVAAELLESQGLGDSKNWTAQKVVKATNLLQKLASEKTQLTGL